MKQKDIPYTIKPMTAAIAQQYGLDLAEWPEDYAFHVVTWKDEEGELSGYIAKVGDKWWTQASNEDDIFDTEAACVRWLQENLN